MKFNINEEKDLLAHIDEATRSEVIRRFAAYHREITQLEKEIQHLKGQFDQIKTPTRHLPTNFVDKTVRSGSKLVVAALNRAPKCTVFYCKTMNRFSVITNEVRLARLTRNAECIGVYTSDGLDKNEMIEDLYSVFE